MSRDRAFHHELAENCASSPAASSWRWEEFYHRLLAGEDQLVLARVDMDFFREQLLALRPPDAIETDIRLVLRSAIVKRDLSAFIRLVFAGAEIAQRKLNLEDVPLGTLLLHLGKADAAIDNAREGRHLRVPAKVALSLSVELLATGYGEEARRLFELAEPLDLLSTGLTAQDSLRNDSWLVLDAWVRAVVHFRPVPETIETIRRVRGAPHPLGQDDVAAATRAIQNNLLFGAGYELLEQGRWADFAVVCQQVDRDQVGDKSVWFWLQMYAWKRRMSLGDRDAADAVLRQTLGAVNPSQLEPDERVELAQGIYRVLGDLEMVRSCLGNVPQPNLRSDVLDSDLGLRPFLQRFRLNRLLYCLGDQRSPAEIVPRPDHPRDLGLVYFERAVCEIAQIWGEAWKGQPIDPSAFVRRVIPILRLYYRSPEEIREWSQWYVARRARGELYTLLVDAAAEHGFDVMDQLRVAFEAEWGTSESSDNWPIDDQRQVIIALWKQGAALDWVRARLDGLETRMTETSDVLSRMEECQKQADAWINVGDLDSANRLIARMMRLAVGVGRRKEYQMSHWIEWLARMNTLEPELAGKRIGWLARTIVTLEDSTEGKAAWLAASDLIEATFTWSPGRAVHLFQWFLDHGAALHEHAVRALLRAALDASACPTTQVSLCLTNLVLPLATDIDERLVGKLIDRTISQHTTSGALEISRDLVSGVMRWALPSQRSGWRRAIGQALRRSGIDSTEVGIVQADLMPRKGDSSSQSLSLDDGTTFTLDDTIAHCDTLADLQALAIREAPDSYFDWTEVVKHVAGRSDRAGVYAAAQVPQTKLRACRPLTILSDRLSILGDREGAWAIGEHALRICSSSGWDPWFAGDRYAVLEALAKADLQKARSMTFDLLQRSLADEYWYPQGIAAGLERLLPLLTDTVPVEAVWKSLELYLRSLFESASLPPDIPEHLLRPPLSDSPERALAGLALFLLAHPVNIVAQGARRLCVDLLLQSSRPMVDAVKEALRDREEIQEQVLMILDGVSPHRPQFSSDFSASLSELTRSANLKIRDIAREILRRFGAEPPLMPASHVTPIRPVYELSLVPSDVASLAAGAIPSVRGLLLKSPDPLAVVQPFLVHLDGIAREAHLPVVNVCFRTVQVVQELLAHAGWAAENEDQLESKLEAVGLDFVYRRPRAALVRRAMFHVIAELIDEGLINPSGHRRLDPLMRFYDPLMLLVEPSPRLTTIEPVVGLGRYGEEGDEWLTNIPDPATVLAGASATAYLLGEETKLKRLSWPSPTEIRRSVVRSSADLRREFDQEYGPFAHRLTNRLVSEYPSLGVMLTPMPLVFLHSAFGYDSPGQYWLALNPAIGFSLGWKIAGAGLFRWTDGADRLMVESIWWVDGEIDQRPPNFDDEVGEGWLVVVSPWGWEALNREFGPLVCLSEVKRTLNEQGQTKVAQRTGVYVL